MGSCGNGRMELSGGWKVAWDRENDGRQAGWTDSIPAEAADAVFPGFICESIPEFNRGVGWFWNRFDLEEAPDAEQEYFLMCGYTEYLAEYWLNGRYVGRFEGVRLNYEFEVGGFLRQRDNLLSIRIVSPTPEGIDGYHFDSGHDSNHLEDNIVNRAATLDGAYGGVFYPVRLEPRPRTRTGRVVIRPDYGSGDVRVTAELINTTGKELDGTLLFQILSPARQTIHSEALSVPLPEKGKSIELEAGVRGRQLWSLEEPNLYTAVLTLTCGDTVHTKSETFGFRDFRVRDGFFYLNGERIFLKACNYGLFRPSIYGPWNFRMCYQDIIALRATGFHMFRFLVSNPYPEFIELCDRMGALIYEEHAASWEMSEKNPDMEKQMEFHMRQVVRRDINHPSVVIFGLCNESLHWRLRNYIKSALPMLRAEDPDRLFMLDSGRFDMDMSVGSVSNPGSMVWEHQWGGERPDGKIIEDTDIVYDGNGGSAPEMGDLHIYPKVPVSETAVRNIRTHGKGLKPCFVSEGGIGAFWEEFRTARMNEQERGPGVPEPASMKFLFRRVRLLTGDFHRYGLDDVYPAVTDLSYWCYRANVYQKRLYNMAIRSNPQFAGYNASGLAVPSNRNEKTFKPFQVDATMDTMAPLMWCVFLSPTNAYAGSPVTVEAVLASEDAIRPGDYPVSARIVSPEHGCIWEHHTVLTIPEPPEGGVSPFSFPVFRETVCADAPEGEYQLTVWMDRGAAPAGGRETLYLTAPGRREDRPVRMIGLDETARARLLECGVRDVPESGTILIGDMPDSDGAWESLYAAVRDGASAVFLKPETLLKDVADPFDHGTYVPERLPFGDKGHLTYAESWYYHPINVVRSHPYCRALPKGVMCDAYWQMVTPQFVFHGQPVPEELAVVTVASPYFTGDDELIGYLIGVALGTYRFGKGRIVLNCFKILDTLGSNPAAERLLMNLIDTELGAENGK